MSLEALETETLAQVAAAADEAALETVRVSALGKKGTISEQMKGLGAMAPEERKSFGAALNVIKDKVTEAISVRKATLADAALNARLVTERVDVTLPVRGELRGTVHPVSQVWEEVVQIFGDLGFAVAEGPHIEDDFHNFDALNMPPEHPARQEHDTFYFHEKEDGSRMVLRTHTSPVQIRTMLSSKPPIRIIAPGRTFRSDSDMTHTPMFNQVEALVIDETTHMGHLKWVLHEFCKAFFEVDDVNMRFRASHFPFTEPSMEVDIQCSWKDGQVKIGEGNSWLEILGSGMVHPNVIKAGGLDPNKYQGFAFGMGIDRIAMLKYGIPDLRAFFESDLRWLRHYGFKSLQVPTLAGGLS
ncbi:MAG: phenylalanine--tRNA ligase subunit alpha [Phyllobacteriaceae bacterium]|jgi:phenylalanyl-tRNA synthetase alpha chain|nr:phenylalanine--tRNA ligase subunit alpha [Phyllobacteriaceae bacterium]